ncbi:MAG: hypothetical protein HZA77_10320 [Candidatus Schekmanbacteria bacterium]|nr:hypothetical protein [Candidatus Schekmanbacteria bacterium]
MTNLTARSGNVPYRSVTCPTENDAGSVSLFVGSVRIVVGSAPRADRIIH